MTTLQAEKHTFGAETSKILHLMIHALYTNRDIFLRELVSNASDACDKLRFEARSNDGLLKDDPDLAITLEVNRAKRKLTIIDNGIGMNRDELIANLGTIARSGTQEFLTRLSGDAGKDTNLIGQFGVGFYSAFMVADKVEVTSRRAGDEEGWIWLSDGQGEFTVEPARKQPPRGTSISLSLKKGEDAYLDPFRLEHIVKTYSDHISFPIRLVEIDGEEGDAPRQLNKGSALWMRPKADVTDEQYAEFYKQTSHLPDKPWLVLHNQLEGKISYRYLLFVPGMRPFDLFHPDRLRRVKLYIKKVFIAEEGVDLIPSWLRFMRGVVDSEDLPLNVSRENLQHSAVLAKIKSSLTKKILSELKKKSKEEGYTTFWKHFGAVLKEGLCEFDTEKDTLLEVCRFQSSRSHEAFIGLDDYIDRMPEGQDALYYLTGEDAAAMQNSPQLEGFAKRGYEVLFFTDHVDTFWTNVVTEYKGKKLLSVTKAKLKSDAPDKEDRDKSESEIQREVAVDSLIKALKQLFGEEVKDVRTTEKLTQTPVCLALDEGDMDIRMERFLIENNQLPQSAAKILELNAEHPVIRQLAALADKPEAAEEFRDVAYLLLDQARIVEGEDLKDPGSFARRMAKYLERGMAA